MDILRINELLQEAKTKADGKLGIGFYDLESGGAAYLSGDEIFPTASVFKIFTLAEVYRRVESGELSLDERYELTSEFQSIGSGILSGMRCGVCPTLYDYALLMMIVSDNTSADFLFRLVGRESIKEHVLDALSLSHTKADLTCAELIFNYCGFTKGQSFAEMMEAYNHGDYRNNSWYCCREERNNQTSPGDIVKLLRAVYEGTYVSRAVCDGMLGIMRQCQTNSRIPKYLPAGTPVAHKTGSLDRVGNDAGIVYTPKGNYILALFYNGNTAGAQEYHGINEHGYFGDELLANLSRAIYDAYTA